MTKERCPEKLCELKGIKVTVLEEGLEEVGREGVMVWRVAKRLDKNDDCNDLDCKYSHQGIGGPGSQDPFN